MICVDSNLVKSHMDRLASRPRLTLKEEALQWIPGNPNVSKSFISEDNDDENDRSVSLILTHICSFSCGGNQFFMVYFHRNAQLQFVLCS